MIKLNRRTRIAALSLAAACTIYLIVGFVVVRWIARQALVEYGTRDLGHRLTVGAVRFTVDGLVGEEHSRSSSGFSVDSCRQVW